MRGPQGALRRSEKGGSERARGVRAGPGGLRVSQDGEGMRGDLREFGDLWAAAGLGGYGGIGGV